MGDNEPIVSQEAVTAGGGVQTAPVTKDEDGLRLDRWFKKRFPDLAHSRLEKLLRTGQIRVEGGRAKSNLRLAAGQMVRVPPLGTGGSPTKPSERPRRPPLRLSEGEAADLRARVLYRDDDMLAIDKPAGLPVQGGTGTDRHLDAMLDALSFGAAERPRLVHRLDKDTSGVLLLARTAEAARWLTAAFRSHDTLKVYWALVVGMPKLLSGRIDVPISKLPGPAGERMVRDDDDGKRSITDYYVVDRAQRKASWLAMAPRTGRTHQIRVHCAAMGTPILGDGKYGGAEAFLGGGNFARQIHLHARAIRVPRPNGRIVSVVAPVPVHMREAMKFLGFEESSGADPFGVFLSIEKD